MTLEPIDLLHLGNERVIGVYLVDTPEGPALFDCGPATCFERLREAVDLREVRHLLLSHIHLDHAGAAGHVVAATVRKEFAQAWEWGALRFNSLLFACNGPVTRAQLVRRVGTVPAAAKSLVPLFSRDARATGFHGTVLTDDRAPVEWLSDRAIVSYVAHGGRLEDDHLPTRP